MIDSAIEYSSSVLSGGSEVVSAAKSPSVDLIVGVSDGSASAPTGGEVSASAMLTLPLAVDSLPSTVYLAAMK